MDIKMTLGLLLLMSGTLMSCNEKISPEVEGSGVTDGTETPVPPTEYYFKLTNTSPLILNYNLHKTGVGNSTAKCEVRSNTALSNDLFRFDNANNDISCFFDAEELALFFGGMNYEISASQNTCEYIGYQGFSYYTSQPGNSTTSITTVNCMTDTATSAHAATQGAPAKAGGGTIGCGQAVDTTLPLGTAFNLPENEADLCAFNYFEGDQCDIGRITINELQVTHVPADVPNGLPETITSETVPRVINCGGAVKNCIRGPVTLQEDWSGHPRMLTINQAVINEPIAISYELPKLIGDKSSNMTYANFRRDLASTNIAYGDSITPASAAYKLAFSDATYAKVFEPGVIDKYSAGKKIDGTALISGATLTAISRVGNITKKTPLAAEPFVGIGNAYQTNPFYTFYCYDRAYDIKARIRMVVRDYDRVFPSSSGNTEMLSDINLGTASRQDMPEGVEIPDDNGAGVVWNDKYDWDDWFAITTGFRRDAGATPIMYSPIPDATYTTGFFNPASFPQNAE